MEPHIPDDYCLNHNLNVAHFYLSEDSKEKFEETHPEQEAIFQHIQALIKDGVSFESICILTRTNSQLMELSRFLSEKNLPIQIHSPGGFFQKREVIDALSVLKFLVNPHDNLNLLCILRSQWFYVEDRHLISSITSSKDSYFNQFLSSQDKTEFSRFKALVQYNQLTSTTSLGFIFEKILIDEGFFDQSYLIDPSGKFEANLWKLIHLLKTEEKKSGFNHLKFIEENTQNTMNDFQSHSEAVSAISPDRINLMTIHASKGLQFDHVLIPFLNTKLNTTNTQSLVVDQSCFKWSLQIPLDDEQKLHIPPPAIQLLHQTRQNEFEESLRVFYVALTRARKTIALFSFGPIKNKSWASFVPLSSEPGQHQTSNYSYSVHCPPYQENLYFEYKPSPHLNIIPALTSIEDKTNSPLEIKSVSHLIEEFYSEKKNQNKKNQILNSNSAIDSLNKLYDGIKTHKLLEKRIPNSKLLNYLNSIKKPPMKELLEHGHSEWGFTSYQNIDFCFEGQIDLWGKDPIETNLFWIIDYKTGTSLHMDKAFLQMQYYSLALRQFIKIPCKILLSALFLTEQKIEIQEAKDPNEIFQMRAHNRKKLI